MAEKTLAEFQRLLGVDERCARMLLAMSLASRNLPDGDLKTGMVLAVESGASWLDGEAGDGGMQMLTLMEQVVGLLEGSYGLIEVSQPKTEPQS